MTTEPLYGFDTWPAVETLASPYTLASTLISVPIPAKTVIGGIDMSVSVLDTNASPTILLDIGDANDVDRHVADDESAQTGEYLEYRPADNRDWYRYNLASNITVTVATGAATAAASGALSITIYGYPAADLSDLTRATLQTMGVLSEGETSRFEDAALAQEALQEVHEMLRGRQLANRQDLTWPLAYVPMFAFRPYAVLAGNLLSDTFGLSAQRAQRLAARADEALREMARQTSVRSTGGPVTLEPYLDPPPHWLDYGVLG